MQRFNFVWQNQNDRERVGKRARQRATSKQCEKRYFKENRFKNL